MSTRTILTALFATALTMPMLAQPATPAAEQPAAAPAAATPTAAPAAAPSAAPAATPAVSRDKDTLSVDFPDEDIKTILRNVADLFELNLVVPDTLTGKTSIKLREVTWHQIFHVVLTPVGYTYVEEGNIIKIVSNDLLQQEPVATEVFILNNAKASDIKPTIDGLIDAATGGKIVIDARSNALVITERPSRMGRIRSIIDQLDKATDQVMIESKFVEVTDRDIRNIGVNWASLGTGMTLGVNDISQTFTKNSDQQKNNNTSNNDGTSQNGQNNATTNVTGGNTVTYVTAPNAGVTGIPSTTSFPTGDVSGLPSTVPSTTTLANITPTSATALRMYNGLNTTATSSVSTGTTNSGFNNLVSLTTTGTTSRLASAVFSSSDFNVIVTALKTQNNTKIVSNPTVVTLNNTEAVLNIGEDFPLPNYTYNEQQGRFDVSGFTYKTIGITLKVTPQVNARGFIKLNLEPEVSQRNGSSSFGTANIPIIATRKAKTQVTLKDGYTMGIGGLMTSSTNHGGSKVPVLGSIPVLGRLFSSKSVDDSATNLLIFITAKTVAADGATPEQVFDPRAIQSTGMTREDLPGNRAAKGTEVFAPVSAPSADNK